MPEGMAQRIKALRKERNLTLEQVADIVGVGKSTVRKWETGLIANMKRDKIASLAKALGTTPEYLMGWEDDKKSSPHEELTEGISNMSAIKKELVLFVDELNDEQAALALRVLKSIVGELE